jgi:WS/DGAT/MGAT family acyltransferase
MKRMTGLDASFLYMETRTVKMHTVSVLLVDVSRMRGGYSFERLRQSFERQIHVVPLLRQRVVEVPLGFHHPVVIEDPDFALTRHLRRVTLEPPGDNRVLEALVGTVLETGLDRTHPLWEVTVAEGLESGHVALVCKVHHAMLDGAAIARVVEHVMSDDPDAHDAAPPTQRWVPEPVPAALSLISAAARDRLVGLTRLPRLLWQTARAGLRLLHRRREHALDLSLPFRGPHLSFNAPLTGRRSVAAIELSLAEMQEVKSILGCTVNDLVLSVAAAGLQRYLDRRNEAHRGPLLASVPVATGGVDDARLVGNKVSSLLISLRTDLDDPLDRLRAIQGQVDAAKTAHDREIGDLLANWAEHAHPGLLRLCFHRLVPLLPRPPINLVISNVRGAGETRYLGGTELARMYLAGPLLERVGLNLTVWSYRDTLCVSAVACPDGLPDPRAVLDECEHALAELVAAARGPAACA